jgi:anti-anti-sigma factor
VSGQFEVDSSSGVVTLRGEFDLANADELRRVLVGFVDEVTLDMAEVTFIDSTALGVLARTLSRGVKVTIANPSPFVERVLRVSALDGALLDPEASPS